MPKNKFGGKHKHHKNEQSVERFDFAEPGDDIMYAYVSKAYGNRAFDAAIITSRKTVRLQAQYKKRKHRIAVGNLIKIACSTDFSNEYYLIVGICGENERRMVQSSEQYSINYRAVTNEHDIVMDDGSSVQFGYDEEVEELVKPQVEIDFPPSESDSDGIDDLDIDDL